MAAEAAPARQSIILGVRPNKSEKTAVKFRIYTDERLSKLFNAYKNYRNDTDPRTVYVWTAPNGSQLKEKQTPQELGLVDEDILDVVFFVQKEGPPTLPPSGKTVLACLAGGLSLHTSVVRLRAILHRLGGEVVEPPNETRMTHYITENLRTYRAVTALLNGVWVVRPSWLLDSEAGSRFVSEAKHALAERQQIPPFAGKRFCLSTSFKNATAAQPLLRIFIRLLILAGAKLLSPNEKGITILAEVPKGPRDHTILTWWEVLCLCPPLLSHNLSRQSAETLLNDLNERGAVDAGPVEVSSPPSTSPEPAIVTTPPLPSSISVSSVIPLPAAASESAVAFPSAAVASNSEPLLQEQAPSLKALADRPPVSPSVISPTPARRTLSSDLSITASSLVSSTTAPGALMSPRRTLSSDFTQAVLPPVPQSVVQPQQSSSLSTQFHPTSEAEIQELDFLIENLVSSSAELESHLAITPTTSPQTSIWMIPGLGKTRSWLRQVDPTQAAIPKQGNRGSRRKSRGKS